MYYIYYIYYAFFDESLLSLLVGLVVINFVYWFVTYKSRHYFLFDNKKVIIKNSLNPFIYREYPLNKIKYVKFRDVAYLGKAIIIYFDNGRRKGFGASNCSERKLKEFAKELNENILNAK